jgi:transcriptional antiterminator RfaH
MIWIVAQTEAQREHVVRLLLMRLGFQSYLPRIKIRKRIKPLFPTYVFVQSNDRFYPIMWTPHVIRLLWAGDQPAKLDDQIIAELKKREIGGFVKLPKPLRLKPGQQVKVVRGYFADRIGIYDGMSSRDRERVLLELLGRQVRLELPSADISPLDIVARNHRMR